MLSCNLSEIPCPTGINMGGIKEIHILRWEDALAVPGCCGLETPYITDPISVKTGTGFITHKFRPGTMSYKYSVKQTPQGPEFVEEITGNINYLRGEVEQEIAKTAPGRYILVTEDWNGEVRLHGSVDRPWTFEAEANVGTRKRDDNRSIWRFTGKSDRPSCYMDPSNPIPHYVETIPPLVIEMGSFNSAGVFVPVADAEYLGGSSHSMRISGQVYENDGITPTPPAVGKEIIFDIYYKDVNFALQYKGAVTFDFTAPLVFGDPTPANNSQPSSDPASAWAELEAYFEAGSGIDATGKIQLDFAKGTWAEDEGNVYLDAVGIYLIGRVRKNGVTSQPTGSNYPIRITGYDVAAVLGLSSVHAINDEKIIIDTWLNLSGWSISSGTTWEIGNNTILVPAGGSVIENSPDASGVGLTYLGLGFGIGGQPTATIGFLDTNQEILIRVKFSFQVTHSVTGVQKTVVFSGYWYTLDQSDESNFAYIGLDATSPLINNSIPANSLYFTGPVPGVAPNFTFSNPRNQQVELDGQVISSNQPVYVQPVSIPLDQRSAAHEIRMTATNTAGESAYNYESIFFANLILI
jgi:hypothetical protein